MLSRPVPPAADQTVPPQIGCTAHRPLAYCPCCLSNMPALRLGMPPDCWACYTMLGHVTRRLGDSPAAGDATDRGAQLHPSDHGWKALNLATCPELTMILLSRGPGAYS